MHRDIGLPYLGELGAQRYWSALFGRDLLMVEERDDALGNLANNGIGFWLGREVGMQMTVSAIFFSCDSFLLVVCVGWMV